MTNCVFICAAYDNAIQQTVRSRNRQCQVFILRKLPNLYKASENAFVCFLKAEERHQIAKEALAPIARVVAHHLTALSETENDPIYLSKASQILDILFHGEHEDAFIRLIRERISK